MIKQTYYCDVCGSIDQDEAYRQDPNNFTQVSISVTDRGNEDPMMGNKQQTLQICSNCIDSVLADLRTHFDKI